MKLLMIRDNKLTSLDHEALDDAVEVQPVVVAVAAVRAEVLYGLGRDLRGENEPT